MVPSLSFRRFARGPGLVVANILRLIGMVTVAAVLPKVRAATDAARVAATATASESSASTQALGSLFIREYRVRGAHHLSQIEIEQAVYPFLGPRRGPGDVEQARLALEKSYQAKGYQTVSVQVPSQEPTRGIVYLDVIEAPIAHLRVRGSRYFSPRRIKSAAPSLAEGNVPNFNEVTQDVVGLNQMPDRRITPALQAGVIPGTVDIDLNVEDKFPLQGSVELNNRYSANTTPLRYNESASYNNLWQLNHSIGGSLQISPQNINDVKVYSGYYVARFADAPWLTLVAQGVKQDSNVSTLGATAVAGRGDVEGWRATISLPSQSNFAHSFTFGLDRKHFDQNVTIGGVSVPTPVTYYPATANYSATWSSKGSITDMNLGVTFSGREVGSDTAEFDFNRFKARGNFIYLRGDVSHEHELPGGFQAYAKLQGQVADQPLVTSEQFAGGGLTSVRGYLEAEVLGDDGFVGTLELRSPSILASTAAKQNEWRFYVFVDGGYLTLLSPLPEQDSSFALASIGVGTHFQFRQHFNGSIDAALPFISQSSTDALDLRVTFRLWADF
jgi:hemolysin activation/secretion protein